MPNVVQIALPLPLPAFDFLVPHDANAPSLGARVVVPWQLGVRIGIVVGEVPRPARDLLNLREVLTVLDEDFIPTEAVAWLEQMASYSSTPLGRLLKDFLPWGLNTALEHQIRAFAGLENHDIPTAWTDVEACDAKVVSLWREQGLLEEKIQPHLPTTKLLVAAKGQGELSHKQQQAWQQLQDRGSAESLAEVARAAEVSSGVVSALLKKGYARYSDMPKPVKALPVLVPTAEVKPRVPVLPFGTKKRYIVQGGRRSSRLASLLPAIEQIILQQQSVIIFTPEHAYQQETLRQLKAWLEPAHAAKIRYLSGKFDERQREKLWQEVREPCIFVTTFMGMLAPVAAVGLCIILEAASHAYKLLSGSRLFLPTGVEALAQLYACPLIISDAVAPLEKEDISQENQWHNLELLPLRLHVINLQSSKNYPLSADLIRLLKQVQERQRQALILSPRRGFSAALSCSDCGWLPWCPNCDLPLRYHRSGLHCHQCGHHTTVPQLCPDCGGTDWQPSRSAGTQWLADSISKMIPDLPLYRYDSDVQDDVRPLYAGETGVLIGTQRLARLEPLPNLSLLAHSLFDSFTSLPEFRAEENAWRFLHQLVDFLPQGRNPIVILQSFQPQQQVLQAFLQHDKDFVKGMLERRQRFSYPPFTLLAKIQLSAKKRPAVERVALWLASALKTAGASEQEVLGPVPAPVARIKGQHSFQILLRVVQQERLQTLLEPVHSYRGGVKIRLDIDPREVGAFLD